MKKIRKVSGNDRNMLISNSRKNLKNYKIWEGKHFFYDTIFIVLVTLVALLTGATSHLGIRWNVMTRRCDLERVINGGRRGQKGPNSLHQMDYYRSISSLPHGILEESTKLHNGLNRGQWWFGAASNTVIHNEFLKF